MKKIFVFGVLVGIGWGVLVPWPVRAGFVCRQVHSPVAGARWKPAVGYFMSLRTNPKHFWNWAHSKKLISRHPEFLIEGLVSGDFHYQNMAARSRLEKVKVDFMDLDDGGRGAFTFDLVRYLVTGQAIAQDHALLKPVLDAYIDGLLGAKAKKPKRVEQVSEISAKKLAAAEAEFQQKNIRNGRQLNHERLGLTLMKESSIAEKALIQSTAQTLAVKLGAVEILDVASRRRVDGGSQGFLRVWALLKFADGSLRIFEAKEIGEPAISEYREQIPFAARIQKLIEVFWNEPVTDYGVVAVLDVGAGSRDFWFRPRGKKHFKTELPDVNNAKALSNYQDEVLYFANYLGRRHGGQEAAHKFAEAVQKNPREFIDYVLELTREYREISQGQFHRQDRE